MSRLTAVALLLICAGGLRVLCDVTILADTGPLPLKIPFVEFPMDAVGPTWKGEDLVLGEAIEQRAGVSEYVYRLYRKDVRSFWFYVGYVSGWAPDAIHHPAVCFPGSGLILQSNHLAEFGAQGLEMPLRFKEYVWESPQGGEVYTLSSFYYNGKFEPEEWRLRNDRVFGIRFFAVITVSGPIVGSVAETRAAMEDVLRSSMPRLLLHFTDGGT